MHRMNFMVRDVAGNTELNYSKYFMPPPNEGSTNYLFISYVSTQLPYTVKKSKYREDT